MATRVIVLVVAAKDGAMLAARLKKVKYPRKNAHFEM